MTVYGWDASDFDWDRGPMNLTAAYAAGVRLFTHKATEGTSIKHAHTGDALARARDAGVPVVGAYHVVRTAPSAVAQANYFLNYLDACAPWWRAHNHFILQVDLEKWSYDGVLASKGLDFVGALTARADGHQVIVYASKGQYGDGLASLPDGVPLWNANYPSGAGGLAPSTGYAAAGGDSGPGWKSYSGRMPIIWQYTDTGILGQPDCDLNAFKGSLGDLLAWSARDGAQQQDADPSGPATVEGWAGMPKEFVVTVPFGTPPVPTIFYVNLGQMRRPIGLTSPQYHALHDEDVLGGLGIPQLPDGKLSYADIDPDSSTSLVTAFWNATHPA